MAGLPEPLSGSKPTTNTPLISPKLDAHDVVLVQEDWIDPAPPVPFLDLHHDDLIAAATHPYKSTPVTPPLGQDPRSKDALISDGLNMPSRFPLGESTHTMWAGCFGALIPLDGGASDCSALKGFTLTRMKLADGAEVDVYNVNGEAGGTAADQQLRAADFVELAAFINRQSSGRPIILRRGHQPPHRRRAPQRLGHGRS